MCDTSAILQKLGSVEQGGRHHFMISADPRFGPGLAELLEENDIVPGLLDVLDELPSRPAWYSMPVYTRYSQLGFMAGLGFGEMNRHLIRASTGFLERELARRASSGDDRVRDYLLCMVTVTGWNLDHIPERMINGCNDGSLDYLKPHIFIGDLRQEPLAAFDIRQDGSAPALQPPDSRCAEFTTAALDNSTDYFGYQTPAPEGWPAGRQRWWPDRVYIRIVGYPNGGKSN
jgi:hypothetical protein